MKVQAKISIRVARKSLLVMWAYLRVFIQIQLKTNIIRGKGIFEL